MILVRLLRAHCNLLQQRRKLEELLDQCTEGEPGIRSSRSVRKLRAWDQEVIDEVLAAYREGAPIAVLSRQYGLHHQTIRAYLRRAGLPLPSASWGTSS